MKFCFRTDTRGSIEWLDPAPRLHIGDCFEIRNCRLGPCGLLLSSHQKFVSSRYGFAIASSAWDPCNFGPFTDLAISVFREMSMNTVLTQILTSLECGLQKKLHEKNWRENLRVLEFHQPPHFPLNSCSHSGISEFNGLPRSIRVSFLFRCGILLAWVSSGCPDLSSTEVDTCTGEVSLLIPSSRSRI